MRTSQRYALIYITEVVVAVVVVVAAAAVALVAAAAGVACMQMRCCSSQMSISCVCPIWSGFRTLSRSAGHMLQLPMMQQQQLRTACSAVKLQPGLCVRVCVRVCSRSRTAISPKRQRKNLRAHLV